MPTTKNEPTPEHVEYVLQLKNTKSFTGGNTIMGELFLMLLTHYFNTPIEQRPNYMQGYAKFMKRSMETLRKGSSCIWAKGTWDVHEHLVKVEEG